MINGSVEGESKVIGNLNAFPDVLKGGLKNGITRACLRLERHVKQDKLTGQVLNVRTGRLRRSVIAASRRTARASSAMSARM
jgi:hypothetical protein